MNIKDKVAIVTGGASGLGEATVRRYVAQGAKVAIFDMNDDGGKALQTELGDNVLYCSVDVTKDELVASAIAQVAQTFSAVHICNNFAGVASAVKTVGKKGAFPLDHFQKIIDINLIGTFNVVRLVALQMSEQPLIDQESGRGVIINTASVAAFEGQIGQAAYSASKGGIVGMTLPIARDLADYGIRVNCIAPGLIHTPLFDSLPEKAYESLCNSPLYPKRLGKPEEIAHLCQYIVENNYTNGECIRMDAGIRMQPR